MVYARVSETKCGVDAGTSAVSVTKAMLMPAPFSSLSIILGPTLNGFFAVLDHYISARKHDSLFGYS
jgi:hypothetical protein